MLPDRRDQRQSHSHDSFGVSRSLHRSAERGVIEYLAPYDGRLEVAGIIGRWSVTIAGERAALKDLVAQLNQRGVDVRMVPVSIPSHCAYIEPLRERLIALLARVRPRPSQLPFYSTVTGEAMRGDELTADYWYANARRPVLFDAAMRVLLAHGERVFVESSALAAVPHRHAAPMQPAA